MTVSVSSALPLDENQENAPYLPGDLVVWLLVLLELLTFTILFAGFAGARAFNPELFAQGQSTLDLQSGAINTVLLISASACAALALHRVREGEHKTGANWLVGAILFGLGFICVKSMEYFTKWQEGIDIADNTFGMLYIGLTGFHFLHALAGCIFFAMLLRPTFQGRYTPKNCRTLETVTVFWHMVDLLWMVLFPLVYVLR